MLDPRSLRGAALSLVALVASAASSGCRASLPAGVERELARAPEGQTVIVSFTDFQCPFCRRTHAALEPLVRARAPKVRVVLRHVPLPRHPDADGAARAAICAERLASREVADAVTRALFTAPDLGEAACATIVTGEGVALEPYRACLVSAETDRRLADDLAAFDEARGDGVPLLFVGRQRLEGSQDRATLERAIDVALAR